MYEFTQYSCTDFVSALAGKDPVPGGGGASALVGAIGTALANMVCSLTLGKKKYADVQDEIASIASKADALRETLLLLVEQDAEAFEPLSKAYGLPKDTPEEQAHRIDIMEAALNTACAVPLSIMEQCCAVVALVEELARIGSKLAVSDAGCAAACCRAAITGGALNVFINTAAMTDRAAADAYNERANRMLTEFVPRCDRVYQSVMARFIR